MATWLLFVWFASQWLRSNIRRKRLENSICSFVNAYLWLLQGFVSEHPRPRYERVDKFWVEGTEAFGSQSGSYQQQQLKEPVYGNQLIHFYRVSITTALYTTLKDLLQYCWNSLLVTSLSKTMINNSGRFAPQLHADLDQTVTHVQTPQCPNDFSKMSFVTFEPTSLEAIGSNHTVLE